ncbi:DDE-TNP-IS1595 domain-containing protein [Vairimorpha necatrix]|uniref:DDE-TNP-IS1595 domain-containing protein n=1 Tax=Vairimorpha necatrix TaxID=6039 RepID=A0AAX4JAU1_9MICR
MLTNEEINIAYEKIKEKLLKIKCSKCGKEVKKRQQKGNADRCIGKKCKNERSLFANTIFAKTHLDHILMLKILNLWLTKIPLLLIAKLLSISPSIVSRCLQRFLLDEVYHKYMKKAKGTLGSLEIIVEVGESTFGKRKYNVGHKVEGVWVLGMVERTLGL